MPKAEYKLSNGEAVFPKIGPKNTQIKMEHTDPLINITQQKLFFNKNGLRFNFIDKVAPANRN